jgi:hypothetical protein
MVHAGALFSACLSTVLGAPSCRYLPGDVGWPTAAQWNNLNSTVGGRLVTTYPLGSPCHDPTYDAAMCIITEPMAEPPVTVGFANSWEIESMLIGL